MRLAAFLAVSAAFLAATPVIAKDKKPVDPNKKICRRYATTGTILGGKSECRTKAEWIEIDARNNAAASKFTDPNAGAGGVRP